MFTAPYREQQPRREVTDRRAVDTMRLEYFASTGQSLAEAVSFARRLPGCKGINVPHKVKSENPLEGLVALSKVLPTGVEDVCPHFSVKKASQKGGATRQSSIRLDQPSPVRHWRSKSTELKKESKLRESDR